MFLRKNYFKKLSALVLFLLTLCPSFSNVRADITAGGTCSKKVMDKENFLNMQAKKLKDEYICLCRDICPLYAAIMHERFKALGTSKNLGSHADENIYSCAESLLKVFKSQDERLVNAKVMFHQAIYICGECVYSPVLRLEKHHMKFKAICFRFRSFLKTAEQIETIYEMDPGSFLKRVLSEVTLSDYMDFQRLKLRFSVVS